MARGKRESGCDQSDKLGFLPQKLRDRLMPFQRDGVLFGLEKNGRCLVADEMGLGKTLQALSIAFYYKSKWPLLIVVPASLRYPWIEEVEKWIPDIHPHDINLIQGGADIGQIPTAQITVVTYGLLRHPASKLVQEALYNQQFQIIIVDESHYIKNRKTVSTKYLVPLIQRAPHKILLTGTPALARPEELFPQLDAILPGQFGSWSSYAKKYCDAQYRYFGRRKQWMTDGASNLEELQQLISERVMIRRLKKNVLTQLPPKQRQKIPFDLKESNLKKDIDTAWGDLYTALGRKKKTLNSLLNGDIPGTGTQGDESTPQIDQIEDADVSDPLQVQAPAVASSFQVFGLLSELYRKTCASKIGPVKDYLKMLCQNEGLKFIVFAHHHIMMDSLAEQLMDDGVKYIRIDGQTIMQERPKLVHEFQADARIRCALLSIKAAGVGLTLTAAKLVVFAELDWTPGTLEQCEDRAHRIGQKDQVHVHYLVAKNTLDEWVWSALCKKTTVVTTTLNGETQVLDMDYGNDGQINCLANAEAFVPEKRQPEDLQAFFQSQPSNQKTIIDFFTPKSRKGNSGRKSNSEASSSNQTKEAKVKRPKEDVVILDAEEEAEFCSPNAEIKVKRKRKAQVTLDTSLFSEDDLEKPTQSSSNTDIMETADSDISQLCDLDEIPAPLCKKRKRNRSALKDISKADNEQLEDQLPGPSGTLSTPAKQTAGSLPKDMWSCSMCTYLNNEVLPYCEMCSSPKAVKRKRAKDALQDVIAKQSDLAKTNLPPNSPSSMLVSSSDKKNNENSPVVSEHAQSLEESVDHIPSSPTYQGEGCISTNIADDISVVPESDLESASEVPHNLDTDIDDFSDIETGSGIRDLESPSDMIAKQDECPDFAIEDYDTEENTAGEQNLCSKADGMSTPKSMPGKTDQGSSSPVCVTPKHRQSGSEGLTEEDLVSMEMAAAKQLFSPGFKKVSKLSKRPWICAECHTTNDVASEDCDGCLASRPENLSMASVASTEDESPAQSTAEPSKPQKRLVNLDNVKVHELFKYCCSKNTSRVYLYDVNEKALEANFTPLDVELDNFADLPDILLRPENLKLVRRFVREWNSLAPTKRRLIVKSGGIFSSPAMFYEELKSGRQRTTQRYATKLDVATDAMNKAEEIGGSVRVIERPKIPPKKSKAGRRKKGVQFDSDDEKESTSFNSVSLDTVDERMKGIVQAVSEDGRPLCVQCQKPYHSQLVTDKTVKQNPWQTRFCNRLCSEKYWTKSNRGYSVQQVYEAERGICQLCGIDAHSLFTRIKNTSDQTKRAKLIQESNYKELKMEVKQKMARQPQQGMFWQVDHIVPVIEGGGMCDIDNLRTLCVMCHQKATSQLNRDRAKQRHMREAAKCGDITAFFQTK